MAYEKTKALLAKLNALAKYNEKMGYRGGLSALCWEVQEAFKAESGDTGIAPNFDLEYIERIIEASHGTR